MYGMVNEVAKQQKDLPKVSFITTCFSSHVLYVCVFCYKHPKKAKNVFGFFLKNINEDVTIIMMEVFIYVKKIKLCLRSIFVQKLKKSIKYLLKRATSIDITRRKVLPKKIVHIKMS